MREIKFRYVWRRRKTDHITCRTFGIDLIEAGNIAEEFDYAWRVVYELISRDQYTGLKDKNGVDIYEGDIIELSEDDRYSVIWDESGYFGFQEIPKPIGGACQCDKESWSMFEIIGNIHENPELLEQ